MIDFYPVDSATLAGGLDIAAVAKFYLLPKGYLGRGAHGTDWRENQIILVGTYRINIESLYCKVGRSDMCVSASPEKGLAFSITQDIRLIEASVFGNAPGRADQPQ